MSQFSINLVASNKSNSIHPFTSPVHLCVMPRSRKHKLKRLEHKYRSFVLRSIVDYLLVACLLFFLGFTFSSDGKAIGTHSSTSPFLHFGFVWTGLILIGLCGRFAIGALRAQAEKRYGPLFLKLSWTLLFLATGLFISLFGLRDLLV